MSWTSIADWGRIWKHFETHPQVSRRCATDFEAHPGSESVAIYIGIRQERVSRDNNSRLRSTPQR
ncbi:hypothetical protein C6Y56_15185 [Pseudomonas fluorescens]|uniref:Uncharacterized protein n=1 Tax=Pseudomonas fluorescens TaxID=294 RepID=A0A7Z3C5F3_PSEFL|nr:hypothetical protein C6Y56_15185 [Pseudomonas fluorescens]